MRRFALDAVYDLGKSVSPPCDDQASSSCRVGGRAGSK